MLLLLILPALAFQVNTLTELCEEVLCGSITGNSFVSRLMLAEKLDMPRLRVRFSCNILSFAIDLPLSDVSPCCMSALPLAPAGAMLPVPALRPAARGGCDGEPQLQAAEQGGNTLGHGLPDPRGHASGPLLRLHQCGRRQVSHQGALDLSVCV